MGVIIGLSNRLHNGFFGLSFLWIGIQRVYNHGGSVSNG